MFYWKWKELTPSRWWGASWRFGLGFALVIVLVPLQSVRAQRPQVSHAGVTVDLRVTLVDINSFQDYQELRAALMKSEGVEKVSLISQAPGLVTFQATYVGEAMSLINKLSHFFPDKYKIQERRLPEGTTEITVSRH